MTTQHDLQSSETQMFTTLMSLEMTDRDRSPRGGWKSDTRLEVLAHEIVRYMPELAQLLVQDGKRKLAA
ncbi:hypothetical protein SAMN02745166_04764 [Prosthecobacter debontii]|uniref:Uncharacterized protein n=1 Tax=Prosthecobacter debontii TaxID=48467 RepID=A0A1T4Z2D6_9BACT|nr:hypothetical protein [Prosthecobacter debontii]SKB07705.1 hypothetical protein SAMN02745166_04764 [Prosthecobacter debontii]